MRVRRICRAQEGQRRPYSTVRPQKHGSVLDLLCQGKQLLAERVRCLQLVADEIITPESPQDGEKLVRIVEVFTEQSCTGVRLANLTCCVALHGKRRSSHGDKQVYFALETPGGLGERLEQFQPLTEMTNGFHMG